MKRSLLVLLSVLLLLLVTSCGETPQDQDTEANINQDEVEKGNNEKEPPINPDDIKVDITILEPNSIGTVYMEATYTNNTDYPITSYLLNVLLKDKNEKVYLTNSDTVMPGETSPKFDTFGPETLDLNDIEPLKLEVTARTEDGNNLYMEYNFKLNEATWFEDSN